MLFDDRLATVLRNPAQSEPAARTQFRQLLDLLGSMPHDASSSLVELAYERLGELADELPPQVQSAILRAPGLRIRNRTLVSWLAQEEPQAAAAGMATARLSEGDWLYLIPRLPMTARGFLRHRRDLPFSVRQVLDRLGVRDLVLPEPEIAYAELEPVVAIAEAAPTPLPEPESHPEADAGIGALVRRIEAFQRARREGGASLLPPDDAVEFEREQSGRSGAFDFATDAEGVVTWADPAMAPLVVGVTLGGQRRGAVAELGESAARSFVRRLPLRHATVVFSGAREIAGEWRIDAAPMFAAGTGQFAGYQGRMRRPQPALPRTAPATLDAGDRMRQILHELRTPVNAIQGYAELIQQQLFGPAPNEYRALAAAVAVDAARLMAGFDEIDRLARLEAGAITLEEGSSDLREVIAQMLRRLEGALRPRSARIQLITEGLHFTIAVEEAEATQLAWRLLATLAGALAPGEITDLTMRSDGSLILLEAELPASMLGNGDVFSASPPPQARAISAGMFGTGFTLRLARAEAESAGGMLERVDDSLRLVLPVLTEAKDKRDTGLGGGSTAA